MGAISSWLTRLIEIEQKEKQQPSPLKLKPKKDINHYIIDILAKLFTADRKWLFLHNIFYAVTDICSYLNT